MKKDFLQKSNPVIQTYHYSLGFFLLFLPIYYSVFNDEWKQFKNNKKVSCVWKKAHFSTCSNGIA